jgi:hypothetical protein
MGAAADMDQVLFEFRHAAERQQIVDFAAECRPSVAVVRRVVDDLVDPDQRR